MWCDATRVLSSSATRDVLDPGGGRLGEVLMPSGFWPSVITNQELFGITRAKLRVEHVATHLLVKPGEVDVDAAVARENALDPPART